MLVPQEKTPDIYVEDHTQSRRLVPPQAGSSYPAPVGPPPGYNDQGYLHSPPPGPSGSQERSNSPSFLDKLRANSGAKPSDLLDPPPPSFTRPVASNVSYAPFQQCALQSLGTQLDKGWPLVPPPSAVQPHPFATHDVQEEDWTRFLRDMKRAGSLSPTNHLVSNLAPLAMGLGFYGIFVTRLIEKRMKRKKFGPASELLEYWNLYFFRPRAMEVALIHGPFVPGQYVPGSPGSVSPMMGSPMPGQSTQGLSVPNPYLQGAPMRRTSSASSSSSSSSSNSRGDRRSKRRQDREMRRADRRADHDARRAERRARKEERRARRHSKRDTKRDEKALEKEKWQLIITFVPAQSSQYAIPSSETQQYYAPPSGSPFNTP